MTNMDTFDNTADYIIFDDFDFEFMPQKKSWWGAQHEFNVTDKYRKKQTITWGKPLIYLCNPDSDPYRSKLWNEWFEATCIRVVLDNKLF